MDDLMKPFVRDGTSNAGSFTRTERIPVEFWPMTFLPHLGEQVKWGGLSVLTTCFSQASLARAASSSSRFLNFESSSSIQLVSVW